MIYFLYDTMKKLMYLCLTLLLLMSSQISQPVLAQEDAIFRTGEAPGENSSSPTNTVDQDASSPTNDISTPPASPSTNEDKKSEGSSGNGSVSDTKTTNTIETLAESFSRTWLVSADATEKCFSLQAELPTEFSIDR